MKRFYIIVLFLLASVAPLLANRIDSLNIIVHLNQDGSALVTEHWSVDIDEGTEWYVVMSNLGDRELQLIGVKDGSGREFINEGAWNSNRSEAKKNGRCGVIRKGNGDYEICWGLGGTGYHRYEMTYLLSGVVRSYDDFDGFNHQFVARNIKPSPQEVNVWIEADSLITPDNTKIWGFNYKGQCEFANGRVWAYTTSSFTQSSAITVMCQFNKGLFAPKYTETDSFMVVRDRALEGASFGDNNDGELSISKALLILCCVFVFPLILLIFILFNLKKWVVKWFTGVSYKKIEWCRQLPYQGNIYATYTLMKDTGYECKGSLVTAHMLRMIQNGALKAMPIVGTDKQQFYFYPDKVSDDVYERKLFDMLVLAAGDDGILQEKEFKKWSKRNNAYIHHWYDDMVVEGNNRINNYATSMIANHADIKPENYVDRQDYLDARRAIVNNHKRQFKEIKKRAARECFGFKKFLSDNTLIDERRSVEVALWKEYLVFAAIFGIADAVLKELKEFHPVILEQIQTSTSCDVWTMVSWANIVQRSIMSSISRDIAANVIDTAGSIAFSGGGGSASFGGGGGFSGGGSGGGAR